MCRKWAKLVVWPLESHVPCVNMAALGSLRWNLLLCRAQHAQTDTRPTCTSAVRPSRSVVTTNPNPRCCTLTTLSFFTASSHTCMPLDSSTSTRPRYCRDRREDGIKARCPRRYRFRPHVGKGRSSPRGRLARGTSDGVPVGLRTLRSPHHHSVLL